MKHYLYKLALASLFIILLFVFGIFYSVRLDEAPS